MTEFSDEAYKVFFETVNHHKPYETQVRVARLLAERRNVTLRAPTGMGKTLSVLTPFFFDGWNPRPTRLIYATPLRTLAQGIVVEAQALCRRLGLDPNSVVTAQTGEHPNDEFFSRGRIIVATYDQVLSGLLGSPYGLSPRMHNVNSAAIAGALVVFDEFHLMEPDKAFLTGAAGFRLFEHLTQSVWMTATATSSLTGLLSDCLKSVDVRPSAKELDTVPSVATVSRRLVVRSQAISAEQVLQASSGRTLIICNTVDRAQTLYREIRAALPEDVPVILLHSRFFQSHRESKVERLRQLFGKGKSGRAVLIATQVVEAGVDISCDDLHTEVCPMNSLVQRAGRCARYPDERGTVHVYALADDERSWLPYGTLREPDATLVSTIELLASLEEADTQLTPTVVADWVQRVHADADAQALREGWPARRDRMVSIIRQTAIERNPPGIAGLIREESVSDVRIIVSRSDALPPSPYVREALTISRWSLTRMLRDQAAEAQRPWLWTWEFEDDRGWEPVTDAAQIKPFKILCLSLAVAGYSEGGGLQLGQTGTHESPHRTPPKRPGHNPMRKETWADHAKAVAVEARSRAERDGVPGWLADGFAARYGVTADELGRAIYATGLLHDSGKLQDTWQQWAEAWQRTQEPTHAHAEALAHTDSNSNDPEEAARERAIQPRRPNHAAQGAYVGLPWLIDRLGPLSRERLGPLVSACQAAITGHHGGWTGSASGALTVEPLWHAWEQSVRDAGVREPARPMIAKIYQNSDKKHQLDRSLAITTSHDQCEKWWPVVASLVRTLRLADQWATKEAGDMSDQAITVVRATGTHADIFTVVGLADTLASSGEADDLEIVGDSTTFRIEGVDAKVAIPRVALSAGYPYLQAKSTQAVPASVTFAVDYQAQRERVKLFNEAQIAIRKGANPNAPEIADSLAQNRPPDYWRALQVLLMLQGFSNTNKAHQTIADLDVEKARAAIAAGLEAVMSDRPSGLRWGTTSVQLFNPGAAKGYGLLKPTGTNRNDKTKEAWNDPFVEWLRYRGYFAVACPYFHGSKGEHVRLLCPVPARISLKALRGVARDLRRASVYGNAPKMDALAVLQLALILINHSEFREDQSTANDDDPYEILLRGATPARVISEVLVANYQSLGQARAVSELSSLAVPGWFPIVEASDAAAWREILGEHVRVVRSLRDDHSDEIGLLVAYRRFLEQRGQPAVDALLNFMGAYGAFLVAARERGRHVAAFTTASLSRVVGGMMPDYLAILNNPGFRAVADAIRRATVSAQAMKTRRQDYREIRYDLLHEIRRRRSLPGDDPLTEYVADFIASYNYENARRREMGKRAPRNVTTEELIELAGLIQAKHAPLVGALLAAYGSCRDPREPDSSVDTTSAQTEDAAEAMAPADPDVSDADQEEN